MIVVYLAVQEGLGEFDYEVFDNRGSGIDWLVGKCVPVEVEHFIASLVQDGAEESTVRKAWDDRKSDPMTWLDFWHGEHSLDEDGDSLDWSEGEFIVFVKRLEVKS